VTALERVLARKDARIAELEAERDRCTAAADAAAAALGDMVAKCWTLLVEQDRLRAVVRKLVAEIGIEIDGAFLKFAYDEYSGPNPLDPDELAAYERALDGSAEAIDG
jgi:hypothetical protein